MIRVGQKLKEERVKKGLTIGDVEREIKIKAIFLSAIEKGDFKKLPSTTYAYGFVRNYSEFLGLPKSEFVALFKREFNEEKVFKVLPEGLSKSKEFPLQKIKFQQAGFIILFIFVLLLGYILFQYRFAIMNPDLKIIVPEEAKIISSQQVIVSGTTDPNATVFINNKSVSLSQNGDFKKSIDLFSGKSTIVIKAINRFGRQTIIERHIEVKPLDTNK